MNLNIEVQLYFNLEEYLPGTKAKKFFMSLGEGVTVQNLLNKLKIPDELTKIIVVNGLSAKYEKKLQEGDVVAIFPPLAGG
jgi:sulfur-carrier protein